ncbi:MAG TPA: deoxyribose-phosphate aldolase [Candidatus Faecivicinus avistercoris]|nr:deoxyribose-phosphate aldolase [Candidatus Faecivicinus avistercoris]
MNRKEMLSHIDHTQLKPTSDWASIARLCDEAAAYGTASVCIPPCYVARVRERYPQLNICTVIGFPLGYSTRAVKVFETEQAIADGANEIDMVVDLCDVKNGDFAAVTEEIRAIKQAAGSHVLKVIVETCYLTEAEKVALCKCVTDAGADYIKTSTGFGTGGATLEDIALFKANVGPNVRIKAAGGVRTAEAVEAYLEAGCDRIGTSSAVKALAD